MFTSKRIQNSNIINHLQWVAKLLGTVIFFASFIFWVHLTAALIGLSVAGMYFTVVNISTIQLLSTFGMLKGLFAFYKYFNNERDAESFTHATVEDAFDAFL